MDSWWRVLDGKRGVPRYSADPPGSGERLLDGRDRGDQRAVRELRGGNGLPDDRRARPPGRGLSRCRQEEAGALLPGVHSTQTLLPGGVRQLRSVVDGGGRGLLEASRGTGQQPEGTREASGGPR